MKATRTDRRFLILSVLLLLVLSGAWLYGIGSFPPFVDETVHIHTGELILQNGSVLEGVNLGRQFTIWWYALFQPAAAAPLWMARTATLLAFLPGAAAAIALSRLAAGVYAGLLTGLLLLFSSYHLFFARLALADTVSGSVVLLAIYFACRLRVRVSLRDALLVGGFLFLAVGAKINTLPFFGVPIAAAVAFYSVRRSWQSQLRWLVIAMVTAGGLLGVFVFVLRMRGLDFLSNSLSLAVSGRGNLDLASVFDVQRILGNGRGIAEVIAVYLGAIPFLLLVFSLLVLLAFRVLRKTGIYLFLCIFGPVLIYWINQPQETRFYVVPVTLLFISGGTALGWLVQRQPMIVRGLPVVAVLLWGIFQTFSFWQTAASNPSALALPSRDYAQYVQSDASGFGFTTVADTLRSHAVTQVIGIVANCQGLRYTMLPDYQVECPQMRPNGQDIEALEFLMEASRESGVFVVLEAIPYAPSAAPGTPILVIDAIAGKPTLTIYELSPQP